MARTAGARGAVGAAAEGVEEVPGLSGLRPPVRLPVWKELRLGAPHASWQKRTSVGGGLAPTDRPLHRTLAQGSTTLSQGPTGSGPGTASVYKMRLRADPHRSQITSIVHRSPRQARRKGQGASGKGGEQRSSPLTPHAASSRQPTAPVASCASLCISRPDRSSYLRGARRRTSRKIRHSCPAKRAGE